MNNKMKKLTNAEEEVMQILWDLGKGFVKDVIDRMLNQNHLITPFPL